MLSIETQRQCRVLKRDGNAMLGIEMRRYCNAKKSVGIAMRSIGNA